jgi:hypothetical protein
MPKINGSVNVGDGIKNFFAENAKTPFITGAQTAQDQIANGTVVGGHIGVTQGYLTYTYLVVDPTNDIARKVVIDAGNGQVLYTSEGKQVGSLDQSMFESFVREEYMKDLVAVVVDSDHSVTALDHLEDFGTISKIIWTLCKT